MLVSTKADPVVRLSTKAVKDVPAAPKINPSPDIGGLLIPDQLRSAQLTLVLPTQVSWPFAALAVAAPLESNAITPAAAISLIVPGIRMRVSDVLSEVWISDFAFMGFWGGL